MTFFLFLQLSHQRLKGVALLLTDIFAVFTFLLLKLCITVIFLLETPNLIIVNPDQRLILVRFILQSLLDGELIFFVHPPDFLLMPFLELSCFPHTFQLDRPHLCFEFHQLSLEPADFPFVFLFARCYLNSKVFQFFISQLKSELKLFNTLRKFSYLIDLSSILDKFISVESFAH
jgi:hypothetical protein